MSSTSLGGLLRGAFELYRRNLALVLSVTVPVVVVVTGLTALGLGELGARFNPGPPTRDAYIELAANQLVTVPLISSILARFVVLAQQRASSGAADLLANALEVFPAVLLVIVIWLLAVFIGLSLIIPGVYVLVSWYFVAQAVVIDNERGLAPILRSALLVRGRWWQSAVVGLTFQVAAFVPQAVIVVIFTALARSVNAYAVVILGTALASVLTLPFLAVGASMYYLVLRQSAPSPPRR